MTEARPSVGILSGQLRYLFEDQPELHRASAEQLCERLNRDDRFARARAKYPLAGDDEIRAKVAEFDERISADDVRAALARLRAEGDD